MSDSSMGCVSMTSGKQSIQAKSSQVETVGWKRFWFDMRKSSFPFFIVFVISSVRKKGYLHAFVASIHQ